MYIMTQDGWKLLVPRACVLPGHTPTMLEREGITTDYDGVKAMVAYANTFGRGMYFTYRVDEPPYQSKPAIHPLPGMY